MKFWQELRRRQMLRLVGLYIVGAWLVIQIADIVFPAWGIPDTAMRYIFFAAILCFPIALVFGWIFDIRRDGIFRTRKAGPEDFIETKLQRADYAILTALLAVGLVILFGSAEQIQLEIESAPLTESIERRENSIAVLPFVNMDGKPETGYFSDGVAEEILTQLSTLGVLHVIGRTSSFAFRNMDEGPAHISGLLGVRYLLHGSVRRDSDYVRVTARLINQDGYQVWTKSFDRKLEGIFAIQKEIANTVSSEIINKIVPLRESTSGSTTTNMEAYDAYLVGKALFNARSPGWYLKAIEAFEKAISLDPGYAPSYAGLASIFAIGFDSPDHDPLQLAEKSIKLDPELAQGHAAIGMLQKHDGDVETAITSLRHAIKLDPTLSIAYAWLSNVFAQQGLDEEGKTVLLQGLEVDPFHPVLTINLAFHYLFSGNHDRAEQLMLRLTQLPQPPGFIYERLVNFYSQTGEIDKAIHWMKQEAYTFSEQFEADDITDFLNYFSFHYMQLGMIEQARDWAEFSRNVYFDELNNFVLTARLLQAQGNMSALRSHVASLPQNLESSGWDFDPWEVAQLAMLRIIAGDFTTGIEQSEPTINLEPFKDIQNHKMIWTLRKMHYLAFAYQQLGRTTEATELLHSATAAIESILDSANHELAETYESLAVNRALLGNKDGALEALRKAVELGWIDYYRAIHDPLWAQTFQAPDIQHLLNEVKQELDRQRAIVEAANAEDGSRTFIEQLFTSLSKSEASP